MFLTMTYTPGKPHERFWFDIGGQIRQVFGHLQREHRRRPTVIVAGIDAYDDYSDSLPIERRFVSPEFADRQHLKIAGPSGYGDINVFMAEHNGHGAPSSEMHFLDDTGHIATLTRCPLGG